MILSLSKFRPWRNQELKPPFLTGMLPVLIAFGLVAGGGLLLLEKAERQARDTTRKHHIEDIEKSLYFARGLHGSYPPYGEASWCGVLNDPDNRAVRDQVEAALRAQHEKYANADKPFPEDPLADLPPREALAKWGQESTPDYFYWKRSPASFELYATLEQDRSGERSTSDCPGAPAAEYDYGVASVWRENPSAGIVLSSPL